MRSLIAAVLAFLLVGGAANAQTGQFPTITSENLNQQQLTLPRDFQGDYTVLLIAFQQRQQLDINTWFPAMKAVEAARPNIRYYELPVLGSGYKLMRGFIDGGMRSGIPDAGQRARTITLYTNVDQFLARLGLPRNKNTIYAVVIDRDGRVRSAVNGRYTKEKAQRLLRGL